MLLNCGVGEDSWETLGLQGDQTSQSWRKSILNIHWKDWCWSWNSDTLATWCEELTHWKRPWCCEMLKAGEEGNDRRSDGWMASQTRCTQVWASSRSSWWTEKPGMLQSMGLQRVRHNWETELNWTNHESCSNFFQYFISPHFLSYHLWAIQLSCLTLLECLGRCGEMRLGFEVKWPRTLSQLCRDSCDPQSWSTDLNKAFWTEWV